MVMTQRRAPGTGSVHYRPRDGRWCGQLSIPQPGGRRRITVYGDSEVDVERQLAELRAAVQLPPPRPRRRTTMDDARGRGDHTEAQWLAKRDAIGCCVYCGSDGPLEKDHAIPVARGGSNSLRNVVPACHSCNAQKRHLRADEYALRLALGE